MGEKATKPSESFFQLDYIIVLKHSQDFNFPYCCSAVVFVVIGFFEFLYRNFFHWMDLYEECHEES